MNCKVFYDADGKIISRESSRTGVFVGEDRLPDALKTCATLLVENAAVFEDLPHSCWSVVSGALVKNLSAVATHEADGAAQNEGRGKLARLKGMNLPAFRNLSASEQAELLFHALKAR